MHIALALLHECWWRPFVPGNGAAQKNPLETSARCLTVAGDILPAREWMKNGAG